MEEALRRAKKAGREPGCYFGGITLRSGRRGFAVYRDGKVVAQFIPILLGRRMDLIDYQRLMSFCPVK